MSSASAAKALLSAAVRQLPPSAYGVIVKPVRGFQAFRIDGYSWTKTLPAGECITSDPFTVGGHSWLIDYYPNGTDRACCRDDDTDTDSISVYLRLTGGVRKNRVRARYKFSLLGPSGAAAYELPAATGVVTFPGYGSSDIWPSMQRRILELKDAKKVDADDPARVGHAEFVTKDELERRRETLLKDDCLAIRCDVGVTELTVAPGKH